jgi:endoglucanase Acf2
MLDQDHGSDPLGQNSFFKSAGHQQPAIAAVAYEPCVSTANHVNAHLFYLASSVLINYISIYVGVGVAGATFNTGIYNQDGTLLFDSGPMVVSGSGVVVFATNTAYNIRMVPGWYYFAFSCTYTVATFLAMNQNNIIAYYALSGGTPKNVLVSAPLAGGALPLTLGVITALLPADTVYHPMVIFGETT